MDDSEGNTYCPLRLCVTICSLHHHPCALQCTRPCEAQNSLQSYPTDTPGSSKVVWSEGPSGSAQARKHPDWPPLSWSLCSLT